ncbi:metallophosphoesterase [Canibacter sp. lx-45]|uniref:metallophosphoesterase n=1 Tax=Canibacter zhuwentaonis TaxID=2837491 RepID=UPI001BDD499E|nr:metallophosphoesterase [Canibacter zhuwentaonis]
MAKNTLTSFRNAAIIAGVASASALAWGILVERHLYTLRHESLPLLETGKKPVNVLHLSDFHLAPWQERKIAWLKSLAELNPDAVVLTGDLLGHRDALAALLEALLPLAETNAKIFFTNGSNDYFGPVAKNPLQYLLRASNASGKRSKHPSVSLYNERLMLQLKNGLGAIDLNNSAKQVTIKDSTMLWFGLNDAHLKYDDPAKMHAAIAAERGAAASAESGIKNNTEQSTANGGEQNTQNSTVPLSLGVTHAPYIKTLNTLTDAGAELIFAGHTHGGQVRVPFVGALTSNSDLPLPQARGLSSWHTADKHSFLHVSAGIGHSIYAPIRFACPPEATLLRLEPK